MAQLPLNKQKLTAINSRLMLNTPNNDPPLNKGKLTKITLKKPIANTSPAPAMINSSIPIKGYRKRSMKLNKNIKPQSQPESN